VERDAFLARVRIASAAAEPTLATSYEPGPLLVDLPPADLVEEFAESLQAVDGIAHVAATEDAVPGIVTGILQSHDAASFVAWDELPVPGVVPAVGALGLQRLETELPEDPAARTAMQEGYMDLTAGITGAAAGLSLSGSVVLASGPGRPRMASLIPLVHIALLDTRRMYRTISHFAAANPEAAAATANLIVITGPSRTGDIEMKLNLGVHGPKHMHVVLFDSEA
jgi:L-lactate dehydrogenase complex protein LldG